MGRTVLLVDDHPVFRHGLRELLRLEAGLEIVGEAAAAGDAIEMARAIRPSVAVIDLVLSDGDGIGLAQEIARDVPGTRVLVLSMHASEFFVSRAFSAGASGYALKSQPANEVVRAVRAVAEGETYIAPELASYLPRAGSPAAGRSPGRSEPFDLLSKRERQVVDLILTGGNNEQIASVLGISIKTVETHRLHVNRKLRVRSGAELIRMAALHGLMKR
jgi:DNA-binding NarL/FixJ family response regulator